MSALAEHLEDYLRMRRALGFQLGRLAQQLPDFVAYLDAAGATRVTVDLAVAWARLPERIKPITVEFRLSGARLRALPARPRPGAPDPTAGAARRPAAAAGTLLIRTRRPGAGAAGRSAAAAAAAGGDL